MGGQRSKCTGGGACGCKQDRAEGDAFFCSVHRLEHAAKASGRPVVAPAPAGMSAGQVDQGKARQNAGKPPLHLVALDGLAVVAWVSAFGAEKYSARGWERSAAEGVFSWSDCIRALLSHAAKLMVGQRLDAESGLPHVGHIAWNALALCAMLVRGNGKDDLPGTGTPPAHTLDGTWDPGPTYIAAIERVRAAKVKP